MSRGLLVSRRSSGIRTGSSSAASGLLRSAARSTSGPKGLICAVGLLDSGAKLWQSLPPAFGPSAQPRKPTGCWLFEKSLFASRSTVRVLRCAASVAAVAHVLGTLGGPASNGQCGQCEGGAGRIVALVAILRMDEKQRCLGGNRQTQEQARAAQGCPQRTATNCTALLPVPIASRSFRLVWAHPAGRQDPAVAHGTVILLRGSSDIDAGKMTPDSQLCFTDSA